MPVGYVQDEICCPVCGHKLKSFHKVVGMYPFILRKLLELSTRYVNFECCQCNAKLIYDTKKETIKIKK